VTPASSAATRSVVVRAAVPGLLLLLGFVGQLTIQPEGVRVLSESLDSLPTRLAGFELVRQSELSAAELRTLRPDDYLIRDYRDANGRALSLFVAFYGRQASGTSIHSPRNCLPGSGWQPVHHDRIVTVTNYGPTSVNRYVVENKGTRALVYYWYQGRGRVASNEYFVKFDLVRDAIFDRRTDEGLVRIVFPVSEDPMDLAAIDAIASTAVREVIHTLADYFPG